MADFLMGYMAEDFSEHALRELVEEHFDWMRRYLES
jgi:hypothetical protein